MKSEIRNVPATSYPPPATRRKAFTLVEMLIIVAIILLLAGILIPALDLVRQEMKAKLTQSNINLITTACDMYANDFEDSPPPSEDSGNEYFSGTPYGAEILALLLTGYAGDGDTAGLPKEGGGLDTYFQDDGRAGFGFRTVRRGKIYGPYNGTEQIPTTDESGRVVFVDAFGNPILYYQRNNLAASFNPDHNPGPSDTLTNYAEDKNYWEDVMDVSDRLILILSPGKNATWKDDKNKDINGSYEDDIMNP